eukprot:scaffold3762_cov118-Isochrysis_galbana.AAC.17
MHSAPPRPAVPCAGSNTRGGVPRAAVTSISFRSPSLRSPPLLFSEHGACALAGERLTHQSPTKS